jgi:hypothetical protein
MTRRNEDSGLIDLDALMREATVRDTVERHEAPPQSAVAAPPPTPAPVAVRPEARIEAPPPPPTSKAVLPPPSTSSSRMVEEKRPDSAKPSSTKSEKTPTPPIVLDRRPANDIAAPVVVMPAKSVPPAPSTLPSKLEPESLDAVTTPVPPRAERVEREATATARAFALPIAKEASPPAPQRGRSKGVVIGAVLALVAAAGVFAVVRSQRAANAQAATVVAPPVGHSNDNRTAAAAPANADPAPAPAGLNADDLPAVASAAPTPSARVATRGAGHAPAKAEGPAPAATLTEAALEAATPSGAGDLGDAMRGAVGPRDRAAANATEGAGGSNASQVRPSPGAVVGALGSVLPAARACLSADDTVRSGLVVFKSDGTVARVEIKGGKPEDECVRSALAKAKVAPFVDESFSTRVTVRP